MPILSSQDVQCATDYPDLESWSFDHRTCTSMELGISILEHNFLEELAEMLRLGGHLSLDWYIEHLSTSVCPTSASESGGAGSHSDMRKGQILTKKKPLKQVPMRSWPSSYVG